MSIVRRAAAALYDQPVLLLVLTTFFWGCNAIAGQLAAGEITPMQHVFLRWVLVTAMVWPFFGADAMAALPAVRSRLAAIVAMAVIGFTGFNILFYIASTHTTALNVGILQGSIPVFVILGGMLVHQARVGVLQAVGILLTLMGVVAVATRGDPAAALFVGMNIGDMIMLLACGLYAIYILLLKTRPPMSGAVFFTLMCPIAALTSLPPVAIEAWMLAGPDYPWPTPKGLAIAVFVAIFPGLLAQQFFLRGVDLIGPSRAGVFTNLVPVFASLLAVLVLGQTFAVYHVIGLLLVLSGIALAQRAPAS